jgi:hypothetical protein
MGGIRMINQKAKIINALGWIIIVAGCAGSLLLGSEIPVVSGMYYKTESYNWVLTIAGIMSSIISGVIFIGFAEIIELLQKNADNIKKIGIVPKKTKAGDSDELPEL